MSVTERRVEAMLSRLTSMADTAERHISQIEDHLAPGLAGQATLPGVPTADHLATRLEAWTNDAALIAARARYQRDAAGYANRLAGLRDITDWLHTARNILSGELEAAHLRQLCLYRRRHATFSKAASWVTGQASTSSSRLTAIQTPRRIINPQPSAHADTQGSS